MGWKNVTKLATEWAGARRTELLTADRRAREAASHRADQVERQAQEELGTSFLEQVLPPSLAEKVTAARPENVAARQAETALREDLERRRHLAGLGTATLSPTVVGGEDGSTTVDLPCERILRVPDATEVEPGETPPLAWLIVRVESPDPVPLGSTSLGSLSVAIPDFRGPGSYDLVDLHERGERGEIEWWEVFDHYLDPTNEADDRVFYLDVSGGGGAVVEVTDDSVRFDLPMGSALGSIRAAGAITWS